MGWLKCNSDGALRGNLGASTIEFCVRVSSGDLLGAKGLGSSTIETLLYTYEGSVVVDKFFL